MSYENPRYIEQDPGAFARGFESTFGGFVEQWEKEKAEKEKLAKENDAILAAGYSAATLGPIKNIGEKLQQGLQGAFNNMVELGFKDKTKAEQALTLQKVGTLKQGADQLNALLSMDSSNMDRRNSPLLMELRNAILLGDDSVSIAGEGEDVSFQLKDGKKITLSEIANSRLMDTSEYQQEWSEIRKEAASKIEQQMASAIRSGMPADKVKENARKILIQNFGGRAEDLKSFYYSNSIPSDKTKGYAPIYKSPDYLKAGDQGLKAMDEQEEIVIQAMLDDVLSATSNVGAYVSAPRPTVAKPTTEQAKQQQAQQRASAIDAITFKGLEVDLPRGAQGPVAPKGASVSFTDPTTANNLAKVGIKIGDPYMRGGAAYIDLIDQVTNNSITVSEQGMTEKDFKDTLKQLVSGFKQNSGSSMSAQDLLNKYLNR
jgi:hypothetical protein